MNTKRVRAHSRAILMTVAVATAVASPMLLEGRAKACGGAFFDARSVEGAAASGQEAIAVTDHRMIVSIQKNRTVLYDQIRFSGHPQELAWVLPVKGDVKLGLSTDAIFALLDGEVKLQVSSPRAQCPSCYSPGSGGGGGGSSGGGAGCAGSAADDSMMTGGSMNAGSSKGAIGDPETENPVTVKNVATVGPYETVQIASTDPQALSKWLSDNGYALPKSFEPILASYVAEKFEFLALKLRPGADTGAIRPVRISFDGASNVVPMRASAAGPRDLLGITMYVVAEGSAYAPSSYPIFQIPSEAISWNWAAKKSNYLELREKRSAESGYSAWEVEAAEVHQGLGAKLDSLFGYEGDTAKADYAADVDALGNTGSRMVTRLHATVAPSALTKDVVLEPFSGAFSGTRLVSKSIGAPICATFDGSCNKTGEAPTPEALATVTPQSASRAPSTMVLSGFVAALVAMFRPRKRKG